MDRLFGVGLVVTTTAGLLTATTSAASAQPAEDSRTTALAPVVGDAWVRVRGVDSDHNGRDDRVHVQYVHPAGDGRYPVVVEASPYWSGFNDVKNHDVDVPLYVPPHDQAPSDGESPTTATGGPMAARIGPTPYEETLRPEGYAHVYVESIGSGGSTGCPTTGDQRETKGAVATIRWLTGHARAVDAEGDPVRATFSTGKIGMIGVSYNGTLANAAASTGVPGLKAIVPVSAISSWYDYYRAGGHVIAPGGYQGEDADVLAKFVLTRKHPEVCRPVIRGLREHQDRRTGDYSPFWAKRSYLPDADRVHAAVMPLHGLADWNVKTSQFAQWYHRLRANDVPHKLWLHPYSHGDFLLGEDRRWKRTLVRWFDHWLKGKANGIMREPKATIALPSGEHREYADWPAPNASRVALHPGAHGRQAGPLRLHSTSPPRGRIVDDAAFDALELARKARSKHRLLYRTTRLDRPVTLSGTPTARVRLSFSRPAGNLSVALVDIGPERTTLISEGWRDPQNRRSLRHTQWVEPGRAYTLHVKLQAVDRRWKPGHRIGLVLLSSDHDYTLRPPPGTRLTVRLGGTDLRIPVIGGRDTLRSALH